MNPQLVVTIAIVLLTWLIAAAVTWGTITTKLHYIELRIRGLEEDAKTKVPRLEYDNRHADLMNHLENIEKCVQRIR